MRVIVLTDFKIGSSKQGIALAEKMGFPYEVEYIEYNKFALLPNWIIGESGVHVRKSNYQRICKQYYDIIISSSRRLGATALKIKNIYREKYKKSPKIIQILNPEYSFSKFTTVILPIHDKIDNENVVRILGGISNSQEVLSENNVFFPDACKKNCLGVLIGGDNKITKFSESYIEYLCDFTNEIRSDCSLSLCITFSRRTPSWVKQSVKTKFNDCYIYDPYESEDQNPYFGILKYCEQIIVTADSISMCAEVIASDKNTYVISSKKMYVGKYRRFIDYINSANLKKVKIIFAQI